MFSFFSNKKAVKPNINSITIPNFGLKNLQDTEKIKQWMSEDESLILLQIFYDLEPDLPTMQNIDTLRDFYRKQMVQYNGGLIEVDFISIKEFKILRNIFKVPQDPHGMAYMLSLVIPFEKCSYVIQVMGRELGTTGLRDSVVSSQLMQEGVVTVDENGFANWFADPYDENYKGGTLMNKSEQIIYDNDFEFHPLTKARKILTEIENKITFDAVLENLPLFKK